MTDIHARTTISRTRLLKKLRQHLAQIGTELLYKVIVLYNTLRAPSTPAWCRGVIVGSLAYFLSTIDGIPDFTPVLGFSDDLSVLAAAIATVGAHITPEIRTQSRQQTEDLARRLQLKGDIPAS